MRIGILELVGLAPAGPLEYVERHVVERQYAAATPQAVAVWCRGLGHRVHYAIHCGPGDPKDKLPGDLDLVFISTHTALAPLACALGKLLRREGTRTVIGGAHARTGANPQCR